MYKIILAINLKLNFFNHSNLKFVSLLLSKQQLFLSWCAIVIGSSLKFGCLVCDKGTRVLDFLHDWGTLKLVNTHILGDVLWWKTWDRLRLFDTRLFKISQSSVLCTLSFVILIVKDWVFLWFLKIEFVKFLLFVSSYSGSIFQLCFVPLT